MKKLIFIIFALICFGAHGQDDINITQTAVVDFRGNFTTTDRDALDVPAGRVWMIFNSTSGLLEFAKSDDVWSPVGGGAADNLGADTSRGLFTVSGTGTLATLNLDQVDSTHIKPGSIQSQDLADNTITTVKILNGTIIAEDIANESITSGKILDGSLLPADLKATNAPVDGYVYSYDNATGEFEWVDPSTLGAATALIDLTDVSSADQVTGNVLISNGTTYGSRALLEADISNLVHTINTDNQNARQVAVLDAGSRFDSINVEGVLEELYDKWVVGNDDQNLTWVSPNLSIENGNSVDLSDLLDNTDSQTLSFVDPDLSITGGNSVDLSALKDGTGTDDQTAAEVPTTTTNFDNNLSAADTNVQLALETLDELVSGGTDDQTAAEVPFTPFGSVEATNVQAAIQELDSETIKTGTTVVSGVFQIKESGSDQGFYTNTTGNDTYIQGGSAGNEVRFTVDDNQANLDLLAGTGTRMVVADATGDLSTQAIPTGTDDQTAAEVVYTPYLTIGSTDVQAAINELKDEVDAVPTGTDDQTAAEVAYTPYLTIGSTDVQAAINELKDEVDAVSGADANDYVNFFGWNGSNGELTLGFTGVLPDISVDIDGRYTAIASGDTDNYIMTGNGLGELVGESELTYTNSTNTLSMNASTDMYFTMGDDASHIGQRIHKYMTNNVLAFEYETGVNTGSYTASLSINSTGEVNAAVITTAGDAYDSGWNGDDSVPTKNDVYDKIETLPTSSGDGVITNVTFSDPNLTFTGTGGGFDGSVDISTLNSGDYLPITGGTTTGRVIVSGVNDPLWVRGTGSTLSTAVTGISYILGEDSNAVDSWRVGMVSNTDNDLELYSYKGGINNTGSRIEFNDGLDQMRFYADSPSGNTTIQSYYSGSSEANLGANSSGGFLQLDDVGGTQSVIRGYGDTQLYGGDLIAESGYVQGDVLVSSPGVASSSDANGVWATMGVNNSFATFSNGSSSTNYPTGFGQTLYVRGSTNTRSFAFYTPNSSNRLWFGYFNGTVNSWYEVAHEGISPDFGSNTVTAGDFILSSDQRLKTNIKDYEPSHLDVKWKEFEFKDNPDDKRVGVIAQDLQQTNPEFVRENEEGILSVSYIDLLVAKNAELEARVAKLEALVAKLIEEK